MKRRRILNFDHIHFLLTSERRAGSPRFSRRRTPGPARDSDVVTQAAKVMTEYWVVTLVTVLAMHLLGPALGLPVGTRDQ
jgi:hypothetical protein